MIRRQPNAVLGVLLATMAISITAGCHSTGDAPSRATRHLLHDHIGYFNARDLDGMMQLVTDDIAWYTVEGDQLRAESLGRSSLTEALTQYVAALPTVRTVLEHTHVAGSFAVARQRVTWSDEDGGERSQAGYAVYEIAEGKIKSVWFFEAE